MINTFLYIRIMLGKLIRKWKKHCVDEKYKNSNIGYNYAQTGTLKF